ncbi:MAG: tRNA pseudouridine(55) synthase TruB [Phycisphaerales bacterium]|nr:tRNA pseudouridine(55) synthase TruB [Phycisphaerales bacterium]
MAIKNHRPDLNGILVIDKPLGMTSARVCAQVRGLTRGAKVGHAGTLDPLATGVLVLCLGKATKAIDRIMATEKRYTATIDLAAFSTTDDREGERLPVDVGTPPLRAQIEQVLQTQFVGEIEQQPPAFSALWVDGRRAYTLAREGKAPVLDARPVMIHAIEIVRYAWPELEFDIRCGKGTYIRSIARDLGRALGTGGMLSALRRTAVGGYTQAQARFPEDLPTPFMPEELLPVPGAGPSA